MCPSRYRHATSPSRSRASRHTCVAPAHEARAVSRPPRLKKYYPFRHLFQHNDVDRFPQLQDFGSCQYRSDGYRRRIYPWTQTRHSRRHRYAQHRLHSVPLRQGKDSDHRLETMDTYLRLDADLARLFQVIDGTLGLGNTFIFLTGTPRRTSDKRDDDRWGIPNGEFSARKAMSLLNVYLMARHGNGSG